MTRRVAIQQPSYMPWLGYFEQMDFVDLFLFFDDVQYSKRSWRSRNRVRVSDKSIFLTVPVSNAHRPLPLIRDMLIQEGPWQRKHLRTLEHAYAKAPYFGPVMELLSTHLLADTDNLCTLNIQLTTAIARWIGIETPLMRTSCLYYDREKGQQRLLNVCRAVEADRHYTGQGARKLLDSRWFLERGITIEFQVFDHPKYPQQGLPFISHLSIVDALFSVGPEGALSLIREGRRPAGVRS